VAGLNVTPEPAPEQLKTWPDAQVYRINALTRHNNAPVRLRLAPFADAGASAARTYYRIWLPLPTAKDNVEFNSLLDEGRESRSRHGNVEGAILEGRYVVTFENRPAHEDWFAVTLDAPVTIGRIVFAHGRTFHDGGWFNTSAGKPQVQIQTTKDGPWQTVGTLTDYPTTTATAAGQLVDGARFTCKLAKPVQAVAIRVLGQPASGDAPQQAFASCGGLWALPL
jgi:uncharacterized protein